MGNGVLGRLAWSYICIASRIIYSAAHLFMCWLSMKDLMEIALPSCPGPSTDSDNSCLRFFNDVGPKPSEILVKKCFFAFFSLMNRPTVLCLGCYYKKQKLKLFPFPQANIYP